MSKLHNSRYIPNKKNVICTLLHRQNKCCANYPGSNLFDMGDHKCLLWKNSDHNGEFTDSGFEIDHIIEFSETGDNNIDNLQLLCPDCHRFKTKYTCNRKSMVRNSLSKHVNNHCANIYVAFTEFFDIDVTVKYIIIYISFFGPKKNTYFGHDTDFVNHAMFSNVENGFCMVHNGTRWIKSADSIVLDLIRKNNIKNICPEIQFYLSSNNIPYIQRVLDHIDKLVGPDNYSYIENKKSFFANTKIHLDNRIFNNIYNDDIPLTSPKINIMQYFYHDIDSIQESIYLNNKILFTCKSLLSTLYTNHIIDWHEYRNLLTFLSTHNSIYHRFIIKYFASAISSKCIDIDSFYDHINSIDIHNAPNIDNHIVVWTDKLSAFCKENIRCLTIREKIEILESPNMLLAIIVKMGFDPYLAQNHNIYYHNSKDGFGLVFNGSKWATEYIHYFISRLFCTRFQNLKDIFNELEQYFSNDIKFQILQAFDRINRLINPNDNVNNKDKKIFAAHIKKIIVNNCNFGRISMMCTKDITHIPDFEILEPPIFTESAFDTDFIRCRLEENKCLKRLSKNLLQIIFPDDDTNPTRDDIIAFIDNTHNNKHLNIVINCLSNALLFDQNISINIINRKIALHDEMNAFIYLFI